MADKPKYERVEVDAEDDIDDEEEKLEIYSSELEVLTTLKEDFQLHLKTSLMHKATKQDEKDFMSQVLSCCDSHRNFDIYQVLAFESTLYNPLSIRQVWDYRIKSLKAIICSLMQITAISIVMYESRDKIKFGEKEACHDIGSIHEHWYMNALAFFVSANFSFTVTTKLNLTKGFYQYLLLLDYNVKWLNHGWLYYGAFVNTVVSVLCIWCAFVIVFYAESAMSMIWAVVSIFFLQRLDDVLIGDPDYVLIQKAINGGFKGRDKKKAAYLSREWGSCQCCYWFERGLYFTLGIPFILIKYITIIAALIAPIYFAMCW